MTLMVACSGGLERAFRGQLQKYRRTFELSPLLNRLCDAKFYSILYYMATTNESTSTITTAIASITLSIDIMML
jgi:hypothetical protein